MCKDINKFLNESDVNKNISSKIKIFFNFDETKNFDYGMEKYKSYNKNKKGDLLEPTEIIKINVPYFYNICKNNDVDKLDSLTKFIGLFGVKTREEAKRLCEGDECMEEIYKKIDELNEDEEMIKAYNERMCKEKNK